MIVSNESGTSFSRDAFVFVSTTPQQRWKEENFEDPFSEDAQNESDPDEDGLTNLVEFGYGSDPLSGTQKNLPAISLTKVESDTFIQIRVFQNPSASDVSLKPELTDDLRSPDWLAIESMDTVIIEKEVDYIDYKIPISGPRFFVFEQRWNEI